MNADCRIRPTSYGESEVLRGATSRSGNVTYEMRCNLGNPCSEKATRSRPCPLILLIPASLYIKEQTADLNDYRSIPMDA